MQNSRNVYCQGMKLTLFFVVGSTWLLNIVQSGSQFHKVEQVLSPEKKKKLNGIKQEETEQTRKIWPVY